MLVCENERVAVVHWKMSSRSRESGEGSQQKGLSFRKFGRGYLK